MMHNERQIDTEGTPIDRGCGVGWTRVRMKTPGDKKQKRIRMRPHTETAGSIGESDQGRTAAAGSSNLLPHVTTWAARPNQKIHRQASIKTSRSKSGLPTCKAAAQSRIRTFADRRRREKGRLLRASRGHDRSRRSHPSGFLVWRDARRAGQ